MPPAHGRPSASVGMPPSIPAVPAPVPTPRCLCTTGEGELRTPGHKIWDHIQPLELSSPITIMLARQHGHVVSSGVSVTSIRGRWAGSAPRLARRLAALSRAPLGISLLRLRVFTGNRLLEELQTRLQLFLRQTLRAGTEMHASQLQQQMTQPVVMCGSVSRSVTAASRSDIVASTNARNASMTFWQALHHVVAGAQIHHAADPTRQPAV